VEPGLGRAPGRFRTRQPEVRAWCGLPGPGNGCAPLPSPYPPDLSWYFRLEERSTAGSSRTPSRLACRTHPVWRCRNVPSLSGLLSTSPASPGSACPQLHRAAATARRWRSSTSTRAWRGSTRSRWPAPGEGTHSSCDRASGVGVVVRLVELACVAGSSRHPCRRPTSSSRAPPAVGPRDTPRLFSAPAGKARPHVLDHPRATPCLGPAPPRATTSADHPRHHTPHLCDRLTKGTAGCHNARRWVSGTNHPERPIAASRGMGSRERSLRTCGRSAVGGRRVREIPRTS
jgi:hypothetical protein